MSNLTSSPPVSRRRPLVRRLTRKLRRSLGWTEPYQAKRIGGTELRWEIIAGQLGADDRSLLDVGCNLGVLTRKAAESGRVSLGIDIDRRFIQKARAMHRGVPGLAFMFLDIGPETVRTLPECDVTLCLSVHHHWAKQFGLERSWEMVRVLLARTRRKLFFEPASIRSKYKESAPDIVDLDRQSIIETTMDQLRAAAAPDHTVSYLGESPCLGKEPFRLLFLVDRR